MRYIYGAVTLLIALVAADFAVSNRAFVALSFWPAAVRLDSPLYLIVLAALFLGAVIGWSAAWLGAGRTRRDRRRLARRVRDLEDAAKRPRADNSPRPPIAA